MTACIVHLIPTGGHHHQGLLLRHSFPNTQPPLQVHYPLPSGAKGSESVDLILTDGRYHREPLPCSTRRSWCEAVLAKLARGHADWAWCEDFLRGGDSGGGSCCRWETVCF